MWGHGSLCPHILLLGKSSEGVGNTMNNLTFVRFSIWTVILGLICLTGCPAPKSDPSGAAPDTAEESVASTAEPAGRTATAQPADVAAARTLLDGIGSNAKYTLVPKDVLTEIVIQDGSSLTADDIALFGKLTDLERLEILNFRSLNDEMASNLSGLKNLKTLALTNSVIGDPTVEMIAKSFPDLTSLDLSSNTNMTNSILKVICELTKLQQLELVQCRFNDLGTGHLKKLTDLRVLDLRGNMEAGDMTLEIVGQLPKLTAFKHRSTTVSDFGMEYLAQSQTLNSLLMQDFNITSQSGPLLAKMGNLKQLEIFRCQGFGSDGVIALKGMPLERLTLRDLPQVDDRAMEVFADLPALRRLYLHELNSVTDSGLANLGNLKSLEILDIWSIAQMSDATLDVIATLPNLKELSIRSTGVTDAAIDKILAMPGLESLVFRDNGSVTNDGLKKLATKQWKKLDTGSVQIQD